jgi:maltooligosyltrehalose trehalohydrolase
MKTGSTPGAIPVKDGVKFNVWAPAARMIELALEPENGGVMHHELERSRDGTWSTFIPGLRPGALYRYRIDQGMSYPDPASRFQPQGVHGPSCVVDLDSFHWTDDGWKGIRMPELIVYELHVGTFSPEGTFAGVEKRLNYLADLGITAIELMPVADFPGRWNWGYDGADLFAPARCYGTPAELQSLVNQSHHHGIAVLLDVVYNHFGPDGAYAGVFSPCFFSKLHRTPWGDAINLDGDHSGPVRHFFIENALYWLAEFHMDGLRLDATHAMIDDGPQHFLAELSSRVHESFASTPKLLIAEDHRNLAHIVKPLNENGWGLDGVWSDDFHHETRRLLAGDHEGYFQDYRGSNTDLATAINRGWIFTGQYSSYFDEMRGTDPSGLPAERLIVFLQNHDQIGNRALGERLHHDIDEPLFRAISTLFLLVPQTPLLFQGQEWAASTPFLYFTDHHEQLGKLVTEGRRREFARFPAFSNPEIRSRIPDPQAPATFESSRLNWNELGRQKHARALRLYRALLRLRKTEPALRSGAAEASALGPQTLMLERRADTTVFVIAHWNNEAAVRLPPVNFRVVLTTEDAEFCEVPHPPVIESAQIRFHRPGAVVLITE